MRLFALEGSHVLGNSIAACLDRALDALEERDFEDGEHKLRPLVSVRDEDVYVIHSLNADKKQGVNDKLCKLLFFIATLKDCGAQRVTAIVPYLCYARKDRRTKARDPVTMRYVAALFEAMNTDRVVTIDVHNLQAYQNGFRCKTEHLHAQNLFISYFQSVIGQGEDVVIMSPDVGGVKRAGQFRDRLSHALKRDIELAFMEKFRSKGVLSGETVAGDVAGRKVILFDDLINSGSTMARAAAACMRCGASEVFAAATHGIFTAKAADVFREPSLKKVIVTNTAGTDLEKNSFDGKLLILDAAPLFAETIRRLSAAGSLVSLMELE